MSKRILLTGDVNLMNVTDPEVPFRLVRDEFRKADVIFSNLECCLFDPPKAHDDVAEGFFITPKIGAESLRFAGIHGVGLANNVNYGSEAILTSIGNLDAIGVAHSGAGANLASACAPAMIERSGIRVGILQRKIGRAHV